MGKKGTQRIPRNILCLDENDLIGKEMRNVVEKYKNNFEEAINLLKPDLDEFYKKSLFERADIFFQFNEWLHSYETIMRKNVRRGCYGAYATSFMSYQFEKTFLYKLEHYDSDVKKCLFKDVKIDSTTGSLLLMSSPYYWLYEKVEENIANENLSKEKLLECYDYYVTQCYKRDEEWIEKEMQENENAIEDDDDDDIEDDE